MKTQRGIDTHNAIVSAAAELFAKKSVSKVTVSDIVKQAGVAKGTFYIYFESKDDLVWHFLEHELDEAYVWFDGIIGKGYEEEDINELVNFIVEFIQGKMLMLKMIHNIKFHGYLGQKNLKKRYENDWVKPVHMWLEKGKKMKKINVEDTEFTARFITTGIHEMLDNIIEGGSKYTIVEFGEKLKTVLIRLILN